MKYARLLFAALLASPLPSLLTDWVKKKVGLTVQIGDGKSGISRKKSPTKKIVR